MGALAVGGYEDGYPFYSNVVEHLTVVNGELTWTTKAEYPFSET